MPCTTEKSEFFLEGAKWPLCLGTCLSVGSEATKHFLSVYFCMFRVNVLSMSEKTLAILFNCFLVFKVSFDIR